MARPFVEAAGSVHPSLIDRSHYMDARFGVTNIPQVMWIDENNTIVRPPEPGHPMPIGEGAQLTVDLVGGLDERERYVATVKDWVEKGANSRYALSPAEVIAGSSERSRGRIGSGRPLRARPALVEPGGALRACHRSLQCRPRAPAGQHHVQAPGVLRAASLPLRRRGP